MIAATLRRSSSGSDTCAEAMAAGSESTISRYKLDRLVQINGAEVPKIYELCGLKACATRQDRRLRLFLRFLPVAFCSASSILCVSIFNDEVFSGLLFRISQDIPVLGSFGHVVLFPFFRYDTLVMLSLYLLLCQSFLDSSRV